MRAPRLAQGTGGVVNPAAGKFQRVRTVRYDEDEAREWEPPLAAQDADSLLEEADSSAFAGFELVDHSTASMIQRTFYPAGRLVPRRAVKPVVEEETWPSAPADDDDGGDGDEVEVVLPTIRDLVPAYPVDLPEPGRPKVPEPVSLPRPFVPSTPIQQPQAVAYKDPRPASDPAVTEPVAAPEVVDEGDYMLSDTSSEFEFPEMPPTGATAHPYKRCIVVDNGSGDIRAGYAGETAPSQWMPNIVGRAKYQNVMETFDMEDAFIGNHAQAKRGVLAITHPVEHGVVKVRACLFFFWGGGVRGGVCLCVCAFVLLNHAGSNWFFSLSAELARHGDGLGVSLRVRDGRQPQVFPSHRMLWPVRFGCANHVCQHSIAFSCSPPSLPFPFPHHTRGPLLQRTPGADFGAAHEPAQEPRAHRRDYV